MNKFVLFIFCFLISMASYGGELVVSGAVYGYNKQPLSGASVDLYFKGRSVYTITTDSKGYFHFAGLNKGDSLVFTYVGHSVGTYIVRGSSYVEIGLEREPFVPVKSRHSVDLHSKESNNFHLYEDKIDNDKSAFKDLYHPEMRFWKVEIEPSAENLSKLDSILTAKILKEIKIKKGGIAKIGFIVDKNEMLKDFVVLQSFQKDVDQKIVDCVIQNTKWSSARQNGQATSVYCELEFKIDKRKVSLIVNRN